MQIRYINYLKITLLIVCTFLIITLASSMFGGKIKTDNSFKRLISPLNATYYLFDLGVVDVDNNGYLDIFTVNHSANQNILLGNKSGDFVDNLSNLELSQDRSFPELEDSYRKPNIKKPGLYIYRKNFDLNIQAHNISEIKQSYGQFEVSLPVKIKKQNNFKVKIQNKPTEYGKSKSVIDFSANSGNGYLVIEGFPEIPHLFRLNNNIPLSDIYIGNKMLNPQNHIFNLMWRDRHSMAWADYNSDRNLDVFIGRGGIRGKLNLVSEKLNDELFIGNNNGFKDIAENVGIDKRVCPARQAAWVDYNLDNLLDIYITCGRGKNDRNFYPNQLYERQTDGSFIDVAQKIGLDLPYAGFFRWLDFDNDGDLDLIASQNNKLSLYINHLNKFVISTWQENFKNIIKDLAVADFDRDGDFDIYVVISNNKNSLLINSNNSYKRKLPSSIGLPDESINNTWVDYDNDGNLDLFSIPQGIYKQKENHSFEETNILDLRYFGRNTWNALCTWFDYDNNGSRDVLLAYQQTPSLLQPSPSLLERIKDFLFRQDTSRIWQSAFYQNMNIENHWLELDLEGIEGNIQAIGSKINIETSKGMQMQQIGVENDSLYSQGNYRAYFGLGNDELVKSIEITWPNGNKSNLKNIKADRLIKVKQAIF